jgi:hypothetical protein
MSIMNFRFGFAAITENGLFLTIRNNISETAIYVNSWEEADSVKTTKEERTCPSMVKGIWKPVN